MKIYKTMDNGVQIVEYDDTLAGALADMWNKSGDSWGGDSTVMTAEQASANYSGGSYFNVFAAMHNGEAVGLCTFNRYYKDADTAYVQVLNVRPDYHGKKVGKELVLACVNRTIELGYPRVDIHTWAGNTKAVPLYKKCGFLWEDRADTTHLSNFIPTILKTELFSEFFETADWYADSTKMIEIKPDGVKINKFEVYGYSWTKDGKNLAVGFEKTGRRMRYVETDDYKIEFIAENHELAFGLHYNCTFKVENKSGKELHIKLAGKHDKGIKFDCADETAVDKSYEYNAEFYVEPISEEIDVWRMHPCVLCDVYINGKHAEFGLGIEPKFPLDVRFNEKRNAIIKPGMIQDVYINVKSALNKKAAVTFTVPENSMTRFFDNDFTVSTEPEMTAMLSAKAEILNCGYEKLDIEYNITLDDGTKVKFSRPLHLINQGLDIKFKYETDNEYTAVNGLWKYSLYKQNNYSNFYRPAGHGNAQFPIPKLGKSYNDEFNLEKPADVRIYERGSLMVFEADFESINFKGAVLTEISEISSSGVITRRHRVTNKSQRSIPLYLKEEFWSSVGRRSVFPYDGEIHEIQDNHAYGFSDLHSEKIDENWVFDNSVYNKSGIYWDKSYKPNTKWGDSLEFEHNIGELAPNAVFETKPIVYMSGVFNNVREFRNYVLGIDETIAPHTAAPIDIKVNGRNPFISTDTSSIEAVIKNNRLKIYGGNISISSSDDLFDNDTQNNPEKEIIESNIFNLNLNKKTPGIYLTEIDFKFQAWEKMHKRALFMADKAADAKVITEEKDGVYTVSNGTLCCKSSVSYGGGVYSLKYGENEWLFSPYPKIEPYSWWNPFLGGIHLDIWNMNANLTLREKISAEFVTVKDNFGTEWTGIKTTVAINEFTEHKGLTYERYFVMQPSLPVLCCFVKFINHTGGYKGIGYNMNTYLSGKENLKDIYAHTKTEEKDEYRIRMGDSWSDTDRFVRISHEGKSARNEKLYIYTDAGRNSGGIGAGSDVNQCNVYTSGYTSMINGASRTFLPVFFIMTEKELTLDSVTDLDRVMF